MAGIIEFDWGSVAEEGELDFSSNNLKTLQGESIFFVNGDGLLTFQCEDEDALLSCDNRKRKILTNDLFESWPVGQIPQVRGFEYFALGNTCEKQMRAYFKKRTFKAPHPIRGKVAICTGTSIDPEPGVSLHGNCKQNCALTKSCVGYTVNNHMCTLFGRMSVEYEDINKANTRRKQNPVKKTEQDLKIKSSSSLIVDSKLVDVSANSKKERCEILKIGDEEERKHLSSSWLDDEGPVQGAQYFAVTDALNENCEKRFKVIFHKKKFGRVKSETGKGYSTVKGRAMVTCYATYENVIETRSCHKECRKRKECIGLKLSGRGKIKECTLFSGDMFVENVDGRSFD